MVWEPSSAGAGSVGLHVHCPLSQEHIALATPLVQDTSFGQLQPLPQPTPQEVSATGALHVHCPLSQEQLFLAFPLVQDFSFGQLQPLPQPGPQELLLAAGTTPLFQESAPLKAEQALETGAGAGGSQLQPSGRQVEAFTQTRQAGQTSEV